MVWERGIFIQKTNFETLTSVCLVKDHSHLSKSTHYERIHFSSP